MHEPTNLVAKATYRSPVLGDLPQPPAPRSGWPWANASLEAATGTPDGQPWPRITVVTPSYNQGQFIEETVRSVLLQRYPNLEYIVMDGGSTDGTLDIIRQYEPWLAHWQSGKDNGQADAIATGFAMATGEILCWLNSDDLLLPGALIKAGSYLASNPLVDCVVGGAIAINQEGRLVCGRLGLPRIVMGERETLKTLLLRGGLSFYQQASFWRRDAYNVAGGLDPRLIFAMDYDLYLKLAQRKSFGHLRSLLACFRVHSSSKTSTLQDVRWRECTELWDRYGRNDYPTAYRALYRRWLNVINIFNNLPVRVGVRLRLSHALSNPATIRLSSNDSGT